MSVRLRKTGKRSSSSTRWLRRQLNDPYVKLARKEGYRSRAAFKLIEMDDRFGLFAPGRRIVDLGCAPGGWTQIAISRTNSNGDQSGKSQGHVVGLDLQPVEPIAGAHLFEVDFRDPSVPALIIDALGGQADAVISDVAMRATGHRATDHLRVMALCESAAELARDTLRPGGSFVAKVLAGGAESSLLKHLKAEYGKVVNFKPTASRRDSREKYVVASGFIVAATPKI